MALFYADRVAVGSHRAWTPEGYLLCKDIPFARTGFQIYRENEVVKGGSDTKKVKVLREYDEVFNAATLASFEGKAVTYLHPPQFLNADNHHRFAMGHVQNVRGPGDKMPDGEYPMLADVLITDKVLADRIDSNAVRELSAGYDVEYVQDPHAPDVWKQTSIRGNHVAVVPSGRAGSSVQILDSEEEATVAEAATQVEDKVSIGTLKAITDWLRGLRQPALDAESEAVERNERVNAEALKRAKMRNQDEEEKMEKEKQKDAEEKEKEKKASDSALLSAITKLTEAVDSLKKSKDAEEEKEKEEKAKSKDADKEKEKTEEKDADLIPVETLTGKEVPENPIPGADKALDSLRKMKSIVADSGNPELIREYNEAVLALKGKAKAGDSYAGLVKTKKSDEVRRQETQAGIRTPFTAVDQKGSDDFVAAASRYHRKNIKEVTAAGGGKEQ